MNPLRLHRVSTIIPAFLLVNVAFIIIRVAQETVVAAASGYANAAGQGNGLLRWLYDVWSPADRRFDFSFMGLSVILWIGMFAAASLIVFRELTGRLHLRHEPILWWSVMVWGCILAGGIASYSYGPAREMHMYSPTSHFHPGAPAHFLYPLALILFACLGLKSCRNRAGRAPIAMVRE